jgi:hypothetical protein
VVILFAGSGYSKLILVFWSDYEMKTRENYVIQSSKPRLHPGLLFFLTFHVKGQCQGDLRKCFDALASSFHRNHRLVEWDFVQAS